MAKLSRDLTSGTLHPRENITGSGALGALNAEIVINADGASTVALDLRGTFSLTVEIAGSVDGTNWTLLAVRSISGGSYLAAVAGTAAGAWVAACAGFAKIRARVTAYTSGAATATLLAATGLLDDRLLGDAQTIEPCTFDALARRQRGHQRGIDDRTDRGSDHAADGGPGQAENGAAEPGPKGRADSPQNEGCHVSGSL